MKKLWNVRKVRTVKEVRKFSLTEEGGQKLLGLELFLLGVICFVLFGKEDATAGVIMIVLGLLRIIF